ncbi:RIC1-domain-containing protein [Russula ochroleuca]|uniref:RIC1-domain-containing protein n=1 Tax=Russula ochroleuca TaxID=152965 RepID=A0A9P5TAG2_9AGAM|nr:RIC1-domain-containing protein [Russula ochroleuca]
MYFPTSVARQFCTVPPLPNASPEPVLGVTSSPHRSLFCTLTRDSIAIWRVRPLAILTYLSRTSTSVKEHGENQSAHWSTDGTRIVIRTTKSDLVLASLRQKPDEIPYGTPRLGSSSLRTFLPGPGEALPLQALIIHFEGVIRIEGNLLSVSPRKHCILFSTRSPPSIQRIPWPMTDGPELHRGGDEDKGYEYDSWVLTEQNFQWLIDTNVAVLNISLFRNTDVESWITSDGRVYFVQLIESDEDDTVVSHRRGLKQTQTYVSSADTDPVAKLILSFPLDLCQWSRRTRKSDDSAKSRSNSRWQGWCIHDVQVPKWVQKRKQVHPDEGTSTDDYEQPRRAVKVVVNMKFSLIAVGTRCGNVEYTSFPLQPGVAPKPQVLETPESYHIKDRGPVCAMEWSSDGYVLAVGWEKGWAIWSVSGRCLAWSFGSENQTDESRFKDMFMNGIQDLFWAPGNFELVVLAHPDERTPEGQLYTIPFAKSATTGQHIPAKYAFLQMDDRVLVYRGADQPDMSVINPESDIPQKYLATNWPIRYSAISADGRLIAIAGRRGLTHYSSTSGRWKSFGDEFQELAFTVMGGLLWFHHVLIAAVEVGQSWQLRLYSRDLELSNQNVLYREQLTSPVVILSLVDNSLLVYTADNTLLHYLVVPTAETIKLHFAGSISFHGVIANPNAVRALSWMVPAAQKQLGDPADDLAVATVLMMVGGELVLLKPRKSGDQEVRYDMQILADRIEFCWIHLRGIGSLENSLWGYDGQSMRVWLNALTIEAPSESVSEPQNGHVRESVNVPLDFYPLSVLMDKGIIIGAEHESSIGTTLPFVTFRHATSSHLFLHHILRFHLAAGQVQEAVSFASHYQHLVFFAHALEILLHTVVESEATGEDATTNAEDSNLPSVIEFLDHFDVALDVVVGCARKTEMTRWRRLFDIVGDPKALFETCLSSQRLRTAGSYLLVLHSLEQLDTGHCDAFRLLHSAVAAKDWQLCRELLRFLHSMDDSGAVLKEALAQPFMIETQVREGCSDGITARVHT